jgi:protein TonB
MDTNKILSANLLDIIFEDRNKDYGAYELRKTYQHRIIKSLAITIALAGLTFAGSVLAKSLKPDKQGSLSWKTVELEELKSNEKKPEKLPEPDRPEPKTKTERVTEIKVVPDKEAPEDIPTEEDIKVAKVDVVKGGEIPDDGIQNEKNIDDNKDIIEVKHANDNEPVGIIEIEAKFIGDWNRFLIRNLNPEVPVQNGAPAGRHTVRIQFVVDKEGNVSDIKPLTDIGYGMEQEAIRVLRKATRWEPAIQSGYKVKAYRVQPITFEVTEE